MHINRRSRTWPILSLKPLWVPPLDIKCTPTMTSGDYSQTKGRVKVQMLKAEMKSEKTGFHRARSEGSRVAASPNEVNAKRRQTSEGPELQWGQTWQCNGQVRALPSTSLLSLFPIQRHEFILGEIYDGNQRKTGFILPLYRTGAGKHFFLLMDQTVNIFSFEVTSSGLCSFLPAPVIF